MHEEYDYIQREQKIYKEQYVVMIESSFLKGSQRASSNVKGWQYLALLKKLTEKLLFISKLKKLYISKVFGTFILYLKANAYWF